MIPTILIGLASLSVALLLGTFVEYVLHRCMHRGWLAAEAHRSHHRNQTSRGWTKEFLDYCKAVVAASWVGFLISIPVGLGFAAGCLLYAACSAYAHQLQHERPDLVFWLRRPVHHLHHRYGMFDRNFGILVDFWDRIFGTYDATDWTPPAPRGNRSMREYLAIKWR